MSERVLSVWGTPSGQDDALIPIFMYMVPLAVITVSLLWFVEEKELSNVVEEKPVTSPEPVRAD